MKLSGAVALLAVSGAAAYSIPTRGDLRNLGSKSLPTSAPRHVASSMKMEDFGLLKGTGIGFDDNWAGNEVISEAALEKTLNKEGLRYRLNRTEKEADEVGRLYDLPGFTVNLPLIGETYLGPPKVESIWEALGFTATSNNEARQEEKLKAIKKAREAKKGVKGGPGAEVRAKWLEKYGYPRLVGSGGIFYADQLSTDKQPMGGFNMGKSGVIWPVPDSVKKGTYGGAAGWGMKKKGTAVDGLPKQTDV
uniref:PS II complex 12 kDa extrinsic protein n=1 Tax=Thalassionema nitzschioides TaxID=33649 RepID=A0A6V0Y019_9STRA|mmetsp:Transcript_11386/g.16724  ORF Transcript_11386/g.16724 Transcript_11386/m.16724 type:complete len:249 (-) Transcript_11386:111-857(-)|eukprot:CAMPEP_0194199672 /NCGR_PEP_ID=MMETSP0156-20130528/607_1 /TAXON_ID=33649 /ORGANISM="Thalassionema nitzschioides, Strain L26-B" /LENGTH=248 /DNA_ID=CAMNT_0038924607 /DNA_START=55 /DNA_END=801 /DNA_ORIENTATION=-